MYLVLLPALLVSIVTKYCDVIFIAFSCKILLHSISKMKAYTFLTIKREREMKATASPIILLFWTLLFMLVPWKTFSPQKKLMKSLLLGLLTCIDFKDCSIILTLVGHFYLSKFEINGERSKFIVRFLHLQASEVECSVHDDKTFKV